MHNVELISKVIQNFMKKNIQKRVEMEINGLKSFFYYPRRSKSLRIERIIKEVNTLVVKKNPEQFRKNELFIFVIYKLYKS